MLRLVRFPGLIGQHMFCKPVRPIGDLPEPRCGHRMVCYKDSIYLFGGNTRLDPQFFPTPGQIFVIYIHKFHIPTQKWTQLSAEFETDSVYSFGHALFVYKNHMYLYGGSFSHTYLENSNYLYKFDFVKNKWERLHLKLSTNLDRVYLHSFSLVGNRLICFGGKDYSKAVNTTLSINLDTLRLDSLVPNDLSTIPRARYFASGFTWNDEFYVYGGFDIKDHLGDMHCLNVEQKRWKQIEYKSETSPEARRSCALFQSCDKLYLFGGFTASEKIVGDLWMFDLYNHVWKVLICENIPAVRRFHNITGFENQFYCFGGYSNEIEGNLYNDMHVFVPAKKKWDLKDGLVQSMTNGTFPGTFHDVVLIVQK